jgi:uncharacterized membrane protein YfcA
LSTAARTGWLVAALAGFGAGLAGGLFGVGGGIVMVPVLTAFFGLTQHQAHGTSLAAVAATAIAGLVVYGLSGHVAWLPAALMAVSGAFTARLGARLAARTGRERLALAFALFVLVMGVRILWRVPVTSDHAAFSGGPFSGPVGIAAALAVGAAVGLLAGYMGVGGGVIAVPALTLLFGMSQQTAQGTSLALILGSAPFGAVEHARLGNVDRRILPGLMLGALLGAPLASWAAQRLPQATLARGFGIFLVANALRMMWAARTQAAAKTRP